MKRASVVTAIIMLNGLKKELNENKLLISVVTGITINEMVLN